MLTKTKLALVGALVIGLGTAAQAGSKDDPDRAGGYRVGPASQSFNAGVNPVYHKSLRGRIYARGMMMNGRYQTTVQGRNAYASTRPARPFGEETYMKIQDRGYRQSNGIRHRDAD